MNKSIKTKIKIKLKLKSLRDEDLIKLYKEPNLSGNIHTMIRKELIIRKRNYMRRIKYLETKKYPFDKRKPEIGGYDPELDIG
jgi:hypothetical protein